MLLQSQDKQGPGKGLSQGHQPHSFENTIASPKGPEHWANMVCPARTLHPGCQGKP